METFIKVIEIWIPDRSRTRLEFGSGIYGNLSEFKRVSEQQSFCYGEGLPGRAWMLGHPIVFTTFDPSYFKRTVEAQQAGLSSGIALPVFAGDFLMAVVVFLCGGKHQAGAIEVWREQPGLQSMQVVDGYYGSLSAFEQFSRNLSMQKGEGIPGVAWSSGMPVLLENLENEVNFIRASEAANAGIVTALGIPMTNDRGEHYVLTFLSAKTTPIAKRIQIWIPDLNKQQLICQRGFSKQQNDLAALFESDPVHKGVGALGRVWLTGMPLITGNPNTHYQTDLEFLSSMLAIPLIHQGRMTSIVTLLF